MIQSIDCPVGPSDHSQVQARPLSLAGNLPPQKVLLLDDSDDFRDLVREFLTSRFYEVTAVSNGTEGVREIMRDSFDLILCDMMMPKMGGEMFYWAATRIRPASRFRFLFITGYQNDPKVQAFFQRIDATVLVKPFGLEVLTARILEIERKLK